MTFRALAGGGSACAYCGFCLVMKGPRQCCPAGRDYDALAARLAEAERVIRSVDKVGAEAVANGGRIVLTQGSALFSSAANYLCRHRATDSAPAHGGRPMTLREVMDAEEPPSSQNEGEK